VLCRRTTIDISIATDVSKLDSNAVIFAPMFRSDTAESFTNLGTLGGGALAAACANLQGKTGRFEMTLLTSGEGAPALLLVGAGERTQFDGLEALRIAAAASRYATGRGVTALGALDRSLLDSAQWARATAAGVTEGAYNADVKKSRRENQRRLDSLTLVSQAGESALKQAARIGQIQGEGANIARELVNLPPNDLTPRNFAERAQRLASENGLECEILDEGAMRDLGMGSLLGVAQGSAQPPRIIKLHFGDRNAATKLAFVGKGLTFDSGGLSLKTHEGMETMKGDMGGAAAVVGGMVAVARMGVKSISVTGYVGATENMPGGNAMRPGDVLTAMNGETIEVLNTDAEGRLVLADVLSYAVDQGATQIVDFATLTGAAAVTFGDAATLAVGRPDEWVDRVVKAADQGFDRSWRMPLYPDYRRAMDSPVADIKNISGGRGGGALTAAAFLSDFVGDVPWAHMDIAGTSFRKDAGAESAHGGTGVGVGAILSLALDMA
jgi:leucyl aminopeptidase